MNNNSTISTLNKLFVPWFTVITFTVITNYYESKFLLDPTKYQTIDKTI